MLQAVKTADLSIGYLAGGLSEGRPIILLHGWPDDALTWNRVVPALHAAGYRTYAPYLRGYGPTRFEHASTPRTGQLSALAADLIAFADALGLDRFAVVGHDWGARAAYIAAALWPERIAHVVTLSVGWGTNHPDQPMALPQIQSYWYQWYMALPRGKELLEQHRREFTRYIWDIWSPHWQALNEEFEATAASFDNADWTEIVIHCYRHRWGHAAGDPRFEALERRLHPPPAIAAPTLLLHGAADPCNLPASSENKARLFSGPYERKLLAQGGHFPHREVPDQGAAEILSWLQRQ